MSVIHQRLVWGAFINLLLAVGAYRKQAVSPSGGITGVVLGTCIFIGGGFYFWLHLGAFFLSSTILGRISSTSKLSGVKTHDKNGRRDGIQVFSNTAPAAAASLIYVFYPGPVSLVAFAASFAAANADTWAGEIGMLTSGSPVSILDGQPLPPGTSGAVTVQGLWASFFGSLFIAVFFGGGYALLMGFNPRILPWMGIVVLCGFLGSVVDSLLGAAFQAKYLCAVTQQHTERPLTDGRPNLLVKGYSCINNDMVNLISVSAMTAAAALLTLIV